MKDETMTKKLGNVLGWLVVASIGAVVVTLAAWTVLFLMVSMSDMLGGL